jgi:HD-GYP domain-containing protein (c-di-GMP phosphodiesterase class II)
MNDTSDEKKELLDDEDLAIHASFALEQLTMGRDYDWKFKLKVHDILSRSYHTYTVTLYFNEEPFKRELERIDKKIEDVRRQTAMFSHSEEQELMESRAEHEERYENLKKELEDIEFTGRVSELKYKESNTILVLEVPDTIINDLNDRKRDMVNYKLKLDPQF